MMKYEDVDSYWSIGDGTSPYASVTETWSGVSSDDDPQYRMQSAQPQYVLDRLANYPA